MKVEVVSIGTELLTGDVLDINAAHIARCLEEVGIGICCRVTVGDNLDIILEALKTGLRRADVVLTSGGLGADSNDFTRDALSRISATLNHEPHDKQNSIRVLGTPGRPAHGLLHHNHQGLLICLPGDHTHMGYLLETEVLPLLSKLYHRDGTSGWLLLRTAGLMESRLMQQLGDVPIQEGQRLTYSSFAGQTDIRLYARAESPPAFQKSIQSLTAAVHERLGSHIYGQGGERLEEAVFFHLKRSAVRIVAAECHTGQTLSKSFASVPGAEMLIRFVPVNTHMELAAYLKMEPQALNSDLTRWCRLAAGRMRERSLADVGLVVYNNVTQSGVQILITLASEFGVSVMQRSFGGHPGNISQWSTNLSLVHLRRWLLAHRPVAA